MTIDELRKYRISEDEKLLPVEKESYFHISGADPSKMLITSNMKSIMEQLLQLPSLAPDAIILMIIMS